MSFESSSVFGKAAVDEHIFYKHHFHFQTPCENDAAPVEMRRHGGPEERRRLPILYPVNNSLLVLSARGSFRHLVHAHLPSSEVGGNYRGGIDKAGPASKKSKGCAVVALVVVISQT